MRSRPPGSPQSTTLRGGLGGRIVHRRHAQTGKIVAIDCFTRDGFVLADCSIGVFNRLKRRRLIASQGGQPYRISREGLVAVRSQLDQR